MFDNLQIDLSEEQLRVLVEHTFDEVLLVRYSLLTLIPPTKPTHTESCSCVLCVLCALCVLCLLWYTVVGRCLCKWMLLGVGA